MRELHDGGRGIATFLCGVAIGAGAGFLFARASERKTRHRLVQFNPEVFTERVNDAYHDLSAIVERGVDAFKKASAEARA